MAPDRSFWANKRVLLTGHTGFKGGWLAIWLARMGARVTGIALPPSTVPALFSRANVAQGISSQFCDICDHTQLAQFVRAASPEIVFHLAAQSLVRASYEVPLETFACNIMGTAHLLDALRDLDDLRVAVMITTDKVYRNLTTPYPYREDDALGGHDPYSASKAASEIVIASYRDAFLADRGVAIASARAGNVLGGGDWSEDRLIPDLIRAWQSNRAAPIRRPNAVRPWQHVLDPLAGYLRLAEHLWEKPSLAGAYNFGPNSAENATVRQVVELARCSFGSGEVVYDEDGREGPREAELLALETAKSRAVLGVSPVWPLATAIRKTMEWYRSDLNGANARELCEVEISAFERSNAAV